MCGILSFPRSRSHRPDRRISDDFQSPPSKSVAAALCSASRRCRCLRVGRGQNVRGSTGCVAWCSRWLQDCTSEGIEVTEPTEAVYWHTRTTGQDSSTTPSVRNDGQSWHEQAGAGKRRWSKQSTRRIPCPQVLHEGTICPGVRLTHSRAWEQ